MDDVLKSKTDLVRRWSPDIAKAILMDEKNAAKIASNLLCNPFTTDEVYYWLLENFGSLIRDEWISAQVTYSSMVRHPSIIQSASVEGTASSLQKSSIKLEAADGVLRMMICSLIENERMVNELYSYLFQ